MCRLDFFLKVSWIFFVWIERVGKGSSGAAWSKLGGVWGWELLVVWVLYGKFPKLCVETDAFW